MKVKFNFDLDVWITNLEIEGEDLAECKKKLNAMTFEELVEEGYVEKYDVKEIDYEVLEREYKAKVTNITYIDDEAEEVEDDSLPKEMEVSYAYDECSTYSHYTYITEALEEALNLPKGIMLDDFEFDTKSEEEE